MNLLVLSLMLIVASPDVQFVGFGKELLLNTQSFSSWAWALLMRLRTSAS